MSELHDRKERIFILYGDGDWNELADREALDQELEDGDVNSGDLIVTSSEVLVAKCRVLLEKSKGKGKDGEEEDGY